MGSIDEIFLHGVGDKAALADVDEVSEVPADCGAPNVHQLRWLLLLCCMVRPLSCSWGHDLCPCHVLIQCLDET